MRKILFASYLFLLSTLGCSSQTSSPSALSVVDPTDLNQYLVLFGSDNTPINTLRVHSKLIQIKYNSNGSARTPKLVAPFPKLSISSAQSIAPLVLNWQNPSKNQPGFLIRYCSDPGELSACVADYYLVDSAPANNAISGVLDLGIGFSAQLTAAATGVIQIIPIYAFNGKGITSQENGISKKLFFQLASSGSATILTGQPVNAPTSLAANLTSNLTSVSLVAPSASAVTTNSTSSILNTIVANRATANAALVTLTTGMSSTMSTSSNGNVLVTLVPVAPVPTYSVAGSISGLSVTGLILQNNGGETLNITSGATNFAFSRRLNNGAAYAVTVFQQPTGQTCIVGSAAGTVSGSNITNVSIACTTNTYTVGGSISGLSSSGLVLQDNSADNRSVSSGATSFTFVTPVAYGTNYSVTILTQPTGQTCTVSSSSGTMNLSNITSVSISCTTNTYTVGGSISGLTSGGLVLQDNSADNRTVSSGATSFTFATSVAYGSNYSVTILTQPTGQTCTVSSASGTMSASNLTSVSIRCINDKIIFTAATTATGAITATGGLTGVAAADYICAHDSNKPSDGNTYKALLVDGTTDSSVRRACSVANCPGNAGEHIDWVLAANTSYVRIDGTTLIGTTNSAGLFSFSLSNSMSSSASIIWTGLNANWTTSSFCVASGTPWSSSTDGDSGEIAYTGFTDSRAIANSAGGNCGFAKGLVCVQTSPKRMFVTASSYHGGDLGGISGADSLCMSDSNKPSDGATYKAFLVDGSTRIACTTTNCGGGSSEHADWVLAGSTMYTRADDSVVIGTTTSAGIFTFPLSAAFRSSTGNHWTGLTQTWTSNSGDCTGWTSESGNTGSLAEKSTSARAIASASGASCGVMNSYQLLCVEQ